MSPKKQVKSAHGGMWSTALDEVGVNRIWKEHVEKENEIYNNIGGPFMMNPLTCKSNLSAWTMYYVPCLKRRTF